MRRRRPDVAPFLAGLVALALLCTACSQNPRHNYAVSSQVVASSLFAVQDAEDAAYRAGRLTPAQHQKFNVGMLAALTLGKEYNAAVRTWQPGTPAPAQILALKDTLFRLSTELIADFPTDVKVQLQATLAASYDAVLSVLLAAGVK